MPDPTDATCERCGIRYRFPGGSRKLSPRRARIVARGLRDFVMSDWQSLQGALNLARDDEARHEFARAATAFQEIFNFCFTCRRSVCPNCWNDTQAGCFDCRPSPDTIDFAPPAFAPPAFAPPAFAPWPEPELAVAAESLEPGLAVAAASPEPVRPQGEPAAVEVLAALEMSVAAEIAAPPVRWPRAIPWLERPDGVHGRKAASEATTILRDPIPVMAQPAEPIAVMAEPGSAEPIWPEPAPWLRRAAADPSTPAMPLVLPAAAAPLPDSPEATANPDLLCHNCGTANPPRSRFCHRCRLQITRWSDRDSAFEELAVRPE